MQTPLRRELSGKVRFNFKILTVFIVIIVGTLKILLAILENPFGYYQDGRIWYAGAHLVGYDGPGFGYFEPVEIYPGLLLPYMTSIILRMHLYYFKFTLFFNVLCSITASILLYALLRELYDEKVGYIGCCLLSINWFYLFIANILYPEVPCTLFTVASLFLLFRGVRRRELMWLAGTSCALAILMKISALPLLFIEITILSILLHNGKISKFDLGFFVMASFLPLLSWQLSPISCKAGYNIAQYDLGLITRMLSKYVLTIPYHIALPIVFALYGAFLSLRRRSMGDVVTISWLISFLGIFLIFGVRAEEHYCVHWLIPLLILAALGMRSFYEKFKSPFASFIVTLSIVSTCFEGPVPFIDLNFNFPFVSLKNSVNIYSKLLEALKPLNEQNSLFCEALMNFNFKLVIFNYDLFILMPLLLPAFMAILHKLSHLLTRRIKCPIRKVEAVKISSPDTGN